MKSLTHSQLVAMLSIPGAQIIGLNAHTDARARKTNNPFFPVSKRVRAVGMVGANYERAVNREIIRQDVGEPEFKGERLPWGEWLIEGKVIVHNGEYYLRVQSTPGQRMRQPAKVLSYHNREGTEVSFEDVSPYLPKKSFSVKQEDAGLEHEQIDVRTYAFSSIKSVRMNGQTFVLVAD